MLKLLLLVSLVHRVLSEIHKGYLVPRNREHLQQQPQWSAARPPIHVVNHFSTLAIFAQGSSMYHVLSHEGNDEAGTCQNGISGHFLRLSNIYWYPL